MSNRAQDTRGIVDSVNSIVRNNEGDNSSVWSSVAAEAHTRKCGRFGDGVDGSFDQEAITKIVKPQIAYFEPVARERLTEDNKGLPAVLEAYARASVAYIDAQVAMLDAGISPLALDSMQRNRALDIEETAVKGMGRLVRSLPPGQLSTVLAATNENIRDTGRRFAYSQFGVISLVEGDSAMWNLGKVPRRKYA